MSIPLTIAHRNCVIWFQPSWSRNLSRFLRSVRSTDLLIIAYDLNAQLGYFAETEMHTLGRLSVPAPTTTTDSSKSVPVTNCFWRSSSFGPEKWNWITGPKTFDFIPLDSRWSHCQRSLLAWIKRDASTILVHNSELKLCYVPCSLLLASALRP